MQRAVRRIFLFSGRELRFSFSKIDKFEKMVRANPKVKDLTNNPIVSVNIEEARLAFKRDHSTSGARMLSESVGLSKHETKLGKELHIDKKQINKVVRQHSKKLLDNAYEQSYDELIEEDYLELNYAKIEENKRLAQELDQFKKLYFEKKEIQRLLKIQRRKVENNLPIGKLPPNAAVQAEDFHRYSKGQEDLKNSRIENMLNGNSAESRKLHLLVASGLLDTTKNIKQIVTASTELIKQQDQSRSSLEDIVIQSSSLVQQEEEDDASSLGLISHNIYSSDYGVVDISDETSGQVLISEQNRVKMLEQYSEKISSMGLDVSRDELGFVDFEALAMFFKEFVECSPEEKLKTLGKIQVMESLRSYENALFDKYRNNDISLRVKGRLEFKDLKEKELLNYVKFNSKKPSDLFSMLINLPEQQLTPAISVQMTAKIATLKFNSKENYLAVIANHHYRALLRSCLNQIPLMDNTQLIDFVWSLGKIHQHEHGVVYEKLFDRIMKEVSCQLEARVENIKLVDLSFMTRGYVKLHHLALSESLNQSILNAIENKLQRSEGENLSVFAIQGLLLFLSFVGNPQAKSLMGDYLLPLLMKKETIIQIDKVSLGEIFLSIASITRSHKTEILAFLDSVSPQIIAISKQLDSNTISEVMMIASACNFSHKELYIQLKRQTFVNLREHRQCSEQSISKILCTFAQVDILKTVNKYLDMPSESPSLPDSMVVFSYFPTHLFHQQSPQYTFYNRLCKEIDKVKEKFTQKWMSLSVFGVSSVSYQNLEFLDACANIILSNHDMDPTIMNSKTQKHNKISELALVLFGYSNMKRRNNVSKQLIKVIRELFMAGRFRNATPLAWAQFFNTITNTGNEESGLDEIEMQFAEIVYTDKIQQSLSALSSNIISSLFFSFSQLKIDSTYLQEILSTISLRRSELNNFQLFLVNLAVFSSNQGVERQSMENYLTLNSERILEVEHYIKKTLSEKHDFSPNARFSLEQTRIAIQRILIEINGNDKLQINYFDANINLLIDYYFETSKTAVLLYTYDCCLLPENKELSENPQITGIFQAKEFLLRSKGYRVIRVFVNQFNEVGKNLSIEEEKEGKKKFIQTLFTKEKN